MGKRTPRTEKTELAIQVKFWAEPEVLKLIDEYAERHRRSRSFAIGYACEKYFGSLASKRKEEPGT